MPSTRKDHTIPDIPFSTQDFWSALIQHRLIHIMEGIMPRDRTGAAARAQEALDAELLAMNIGALCAIRTQPNALFPVSSLLAGLPALHIILPIKLPIHKNWHTISDPNVFWTAVAQNRLVRTESISPMRAQQVLDAEFSALQLAMCTFRTHRNSLSPVSVLPPELLAHIFQFNEAMSPPGLHAQRFLGWIGITHVCRHWRDTALHSPRLWSNIDTNRLGFRWAKLMMARSKAAQISIYWYLIESSDNSVDLISSNSRRIRDLALHGPVSPLLSVVSSQSFSPDILETLKLDGIQFFKENHIVDLPSKLVEVRLPFLRRLIISPFYVPWSAPILSTSLTHLEIKVASEGGDLETSSTSVSYTNSSYDELLSALERMSSLQFLFLENCFPLRSSPATCTAHLPQLSQLSLLGTWKPCCDVFQQLTTPSSCRLRLHWRYETADMPEILPALRAHFSTQRGCPPFELLTVAESWESGARLDAWKSRADIRGFFPEVPPDLSFVLPPGNQEEYSMIPFCDAIPLHTVHTINTEAVDFQCPIFPAGGWRGILECCTEVRQARLEGRHAFAFCAFMGSVSLAKLEHLCIEEVAFAETNIEGWALWVGWDCRDVLMQGLERRKEIQGLPEISLHIARCHVAPEWVEELVASEFAMVSFDSLREPEEDQDEELRSVLLGLAIPEYEIGDYGEVGERGRSDEGDENGEW